MATPALERVSVLINELEFAYWTEIEIHQSIDSLSTVRFSAPFEAHRREFRDTFRPFQFKPLEVRLDGQRFFTGVLVDVSPSIDANEKAVEVRCYALPAMLDDCTAPGSAFPVEFQKMGFSAIARALGKPFGIDVELRVSEGAPFARVRLEEDRRLFDFLTELAKQRNLVLSNTADGKLLCWRSLPEGNPVADLVGGAPPLVSITPEFHPQEYYSELTCFSKTTRTRRGSRYTERNKWLPNRLRPLAFKLEDTDPAQAPEATRAKLGRMFANVATFTVDHLPTWRSARGEVWMPNTTVTVTAPDAMIYRKTELLIRETILKQNARELFADLKLVLPGAFSGEVPQHLPWED